MFFFTRRGYETEIKRLQVAQSDLISQLTKLSESHQRQIEGLVERIIALGAPETLRELRRIPATPAEAPPAFLKRPTGHPRTFYRAPRSGIVNPQATEPTEQDAEDVRKIISASLAEGN